MFLIDTFRGNKTRAIFLLFGEFIVLLGFVQPLIYLIKAKPQSTHRFLSFKYFILSTVIILLMVAYETNFISTSLALGLIYPAFIYVYVMFENFNPAIMKIVYSLLLIHKEDDLFNYPKDFDITANDTSAEIFFDYAANPKIIQSANYIRSKQTSKTVKVKKDLIWRIMKSIIQLKKDEEISASREDRRNKIESYFLSLKKEREENFEIEKINDLRRNTTRANRKQRNNTTFDLSESELRPSRNVLTNPNINTEPRLTQQNLPGDSAMNFDKRSLDTTNKEEDSIGQILRQRFNSLHWPKNHFYKITFFIFFPYYFVFAITMPKLKVFISVKEAFFGFIFCLIFLIGLTVMYYFFVSAATNYWAITDGLSGLISSGISINYLIYCLSFTSHNDKYFNISIQEMMITKISVAMSFSLLFDLLFGQAMLKTSQTNLMITGGILASNGLVFFLLSLIMSEKIQQWLHVIFFGLISGYIAFAVVAKV